MKVLAMVGGRVFLLLPVLLGIASLTFLVSRVLPADPAAVIAGPLADEESLARIRSQLGLDRPLLRQYRDFLAELARLDLGEAWTTRNPVREDLQRRLAPSLELVGVAFLMTVGVSLPLGIWAAINKDKAPDHIARVINLLGVSMPQFWLGLILIYLLFFQLRIFPAPVGRLPIGVEAPEKATGLYLIDSLLRFDISTFWAAFKQLLLPAMTLSFALIAPITRMVRNSMIEALESDYVQAARAFGIPEGYINYVYALRNATLPVLTLTASLFGSIVGGAIVVEHIFAWPGLGSYAATSALRSDYTALQGFVILTAATYVAIFLVVDLLYLVVDPRTRGSRE
jgi:ABC-type dipeptide/oligopeptide/nickel transport system permease component